MDGGCQRRKRGSKYGCKGTTVLKRQRFVLRIVTEKETEGYQVRREWGKSDQGPPSAGGCQRFVTEKETTGYKVRCEWGQSNQGPVSAGEGPSSECYSSPAAKGLKRRRHEDAFGVEGVKRAKVNAKSQHVDFSKLEQLESVLRGSVGHQVSSLINNPSLTQYLKISPTDFESVPIMVKLFDNALFCEHETLSKRAQEEVIPKLLENRGFLEVVRYHLVCLPGRASHNERVSSVVFIEQLCKLFKLLLSSRNVDLATEVLPVDTLWGATRQLSSQELRFQVLHDKANEILQMRDKVRQIQYNVSNNKEFETDVIVLPTKEELQISTLPPNLQRNIITGPYISQLQYLNIQYRLLREDFIHPLRCAIHEIESDEEECQGLKVYDATIQSKGYSSYECSTFEVSFRVSGHHVIQWDRTKRLQYGDLVCLMNDASGIIMFATVAERKVEDLKKGIYSYT